MTTTTTDYASIANSFYLAFYGRPADPVGLKFWAQQVANVNGDLTSIVNAFATSQEAQDRFGSDTTADRVTEIYQQLFNRDPEAEGLSFWQNAVEKGNASLADVALAILKGSQGTDGQLVELRQQAMDKFTAEVEASGSQYVGAASIEAARILVRAVTLNATSSDIDTMVKAAVSFADTATKTPAVVDAIATGTTLNKLFDTARGTADPVALAQTLADTAKAAAGNPVTLDSLLRGGGMDKVLKVMPANATLTDVVKALASGGLPAAIEVVYPTKPSVPSASLSLKFSGVTHDQNDAAPNDNVTNAKIGDVSFTASKALTSSQHVEYSIDGKTWVKDGTGVGVVGNVVTIKGVNLSHTTSGGISDEQSNQTSASPNSTSNTISQSDMGGLPNLVTTVQVRVVDGSGNTAASTSQNIIYDGYAAAPTVSIGGHVFSPQDSSSTSFTTTEKTFTVENLEPNAVVQYMVDVNSGSNTIGGNDGWTKTKPELVDGANSFYVRQIDVAGNVSEAVHVDVTVGKPAVPSTMVGIKADFSIDKQFLVLETTPDHIVSATGEGSLNGFANPFQVQLRSMTGPNEDIDMHIRLDGTQLSLHGNVISTNAVLPINFYNVQWSDGTFATDAADGNGYVKTDMAFFAGGTTDNITVQGFAVNPYFYGPSNGNIGSAGENTFYIGDQMGESLHTGTGMDVVLSDSGYYHTNVNYDEFVSGAQDLIIGFNTGIDTIQLSGKAVDLVDRDGSGTIETVVYGNGSDYAVNTKVGELVEFTTKGTLSTSTDSADVTATLQTLNTSLNVANMAQDSGMLLLANSDGGRSGILYYYLEKDGNERIDAGDLTVVATFTGGVLHAGDVHLVGVADGGGEAGNPP